MELMFPKLESNLEHLFAQNILYEYGEKDYFLFL